MPNQVREESVEEVLARTLEVIRLESRSFGGWNEWKAYDKSLERLHAAIAKALHFSDCFARADVGDYLAEMEFTGGRPERNLNDVILRPKIRDFLSRSPQPFDFYFDIGDVAGFEKGDEFGRAEMIPFASLPDRLRDSIGGPGPFSGAVPNIANHWFLHVKVESVGKASASQKASTSAMRALSLMRIFYRLGDLPDVGSHSRFFGQWYGLYEGGITTNFSFPLGIPLMRYERNNPLITQLSDILRKERPNHLEERIVKAIDILGLVDDNTPLSIGFMLNVAAVENLLLGGQSEEIAYRLSERVALLLGDSHNWMESHFEVSPEDFTEEFVLENLTKSRLELCSRFTTLYRKRSGVAHGNVNIEDEEVSSEDLAEIQMLTGLALKRLMELIESEGINCVEPSGSESSKSLAEYLDRLKFSFGHA